MATIKINNVTALTESGGVITLDSAVAGAGTTGITSSASGTAITIGADGSVTLSGDLIPSTPLSHRNMIINGGMTVWQRGTTSTAGGNPAYLTADRWGIYNNTTGQEISQQADAPEGFKYSYRFKCTASVVPGVSDYIYIPYKIEGQDLQHLKKGIANAEAITISFWVKSNKNATYQLNIIDETNSRIIGATYAISSAATWEKKTITFAGDTTGGTIDNDNTTGFTLEWFLDSGINLKSGALPTAWEGKTDADRNAGGTVEFRTTNDYFQITGIQLELGSNATPFEHRSYGDELARCQRYFFMLADGTNGTSTPCGIGNQYNSSIVYLTPYFPVAMRAGPTIYEVGGTNYFRNYQNSAGVSYDADWQLRKGSTTCANIWTNSSSPGTGGHAVWVETNNTSARLGFIAEL